MRALFISTMLAAGISLCCSEAHSQNRIAGSINADTTARKIVTIPQLQPPKVVMESKLGGNVRVKVSVDDAGNVTSVDDVVGPGAVCRQVSRADVAAMRSSAKEAAATARFAPANQPTAPFSTWLNFDFPDREEESDFAAVNVEPLPEGAKFTVVGDASFSVGNPPSNFKGPATVATQSKSEPPTTNPPSFPKIISGGVLNGRANELPKPPYPPAARAVRASGAVNIQVLIDEEGEVFMAKAVSGHPLLRSVSATAACESRWAPTRLDGNPVKVSGIITYNFVP